MSELEMELKSSQSSELSDEEELKGISDDTTYITTGTIISGNVEADGDLEILGRVDGNIRCAGKLIISGRVNGDINAGDLYASGAHMEGIIISNGTVKIGAGTVSIGNISANDAVIAGAVKGDIDVNGEVVVDSTAVVVGNIKSKDVQINSGAIVNGMCQQKYDKETIDKYFSEGIESLDSTMNPTMDDNSDAE